MELEVEAGFVVAERFSVAVSVVLREDGIREGVKGHEEVTAPALAWTLVQALTLSV